MDAKISSSGKTRVAWPNQYPQVVFWKNIISKCHFAGRIIIPVMAIAFMISYWTYAVAVYSKD